MEAAHLLYSLLYAFLAYTSCNYRYKFLRNPYLYLIMVLPMILFTALRPTDITRDDISYRHVVDNIGVVSVQRDYLWYWIVERILEVWNDYRVVLLFSAIILSFKLLIFYLINKKNALMVSFFYFTVFWQLHDLTQLRVSLSVLFFILYLYYEFLGLKIKWFFIIISPAAHLQAASNYLVPFLPKIFSNKHFYYFSFLVLFIFINIDFVLNPRELFYYFNFGSLNIPAVEHLLSSYTILKELGVYDSSFKTPLIAVIFYSLFYVSVILDFKYKENYRFKKKIISIVTYSIYLCFTFAFLSDIFVRIYEYYLVAIMFYLLITNNRYSQYILLVIGVLYFLKFNVFWEILSW
jgi:hypothetical protein